MKRNALLYRDKWTRWRYLFISVLELLDARMHRRTERHARSLGELKLKRSARFTQEFLNDYGMMWVGSDRAADEGEPVWKQGRHEVTSPVEQLIINWYRFSFI